MRSEADDYSLPPPPPIRVKIERSVADGEQDVEAPEQATSSSSRPSKRVTFDVDEKPQHLQQQSAVDVDGDDGAGDAPSTFAQDDWFTFQQNQDNNEGGVDVDLASAVATATNATDEQGNLVFYWFDGHEIQSDNDSVYLFGKMWNAELAKYVSTCVTVKDHYYSLYVVPRPFVLDDEGE